MNQPFEETPPALGAKASPPKSLPGGQDPVDHLTPEEALAILGPDWSTMTPVQRIGYGDPGKQRPETDDRHAGDQEDPFLAAIRRETKECLDRCEAKLLRLETRVAKHFKVGTRKWWRQQKRDAEKGTP